VIARVISRAEQLSLVAIASRAPSAHNTQPARWRFAPDGTVYVFEDLSRRLHVGDPEGRDSLVAIGAGLEALHLALSQTSRAITRVDRLDNATSMLREVAIATLGPGAPDSLFEYVDVRRSYRGVFADSAKQVGALMDAMRDAEDVRILTARDDIDHVATLIDSCSLEFMRDRRYQEELWQWMRLTSSDTGWNRDGLSADCLALSTVERTAARVLMRPSVFSVLNRFGVAGALVSESSQVHSAGAVVLLHRPMNEDPVVTGRRFLRLWLEITRAGLSACPMSAITDSPRGSDEIRRRHSIPDDRRIINAFRVGVPSTPAAKSARLPAEELLV
jgi:nitroreductase